MVQIDKSNFESEVLKSEKTVLVDFWAEWCGPCKMLSPELESLDKDNRDIKIAKVNVDNVPEIAISYGVEVIPTLILFKDGEIIKRSMGYQKKDEIIKNFNL